jgi:Cupin-like domain
MVSASNPDLARFPRFAEAQAHAVSAELGSGDAIYIPYGWWHQVESLTPFNVLVNYWWNEARQIGSPFDCMLHAVLALRDLPADQRKVWHAMFEQYVFTDADEALAHLPREQRGMLGPPTPERMAAIRQILARAFSR